MTWHLIEGEAGCAFAREQGAVAVVVDALRASATAAMLFDAGSTDVRAVRSVEEALRFKEKSPGFLLFGERDGLPPAGFDHGNSPREAIAAEGCAVVFTTTTGTTRLLEAEGAAAIYMGTTTNALAVATAASAHDRDVVLIPAGKAGEPEFDAHEDWVAAAMIANLVDAPIGEGAAMYRETKHLVDLDGVEKRFLVAPHASILAGLGMSADVVFCARTNVTTAVPRVDRIENGVAVLSNVGRV